MMPSALLTSTPPLKEMGLTSLTVLRSVQIVPGEQRREIGSSPRNGDLYASSNRISENQGFLRPSERTAGLSVRM
jgi:hypothetical protein